jgi:hypothetical protein
MSVSGIYVRLLLGICECVFGVRECLDVRQRYTFLFMRVALTHFNTVTSLTLWRPWF